MRYYYANFANCFEKIREEITLTIKTMILTALDCVHGHFDNKLIAKMYS